MQLRLRHNPLLKGDGVYETLYVYKFFHSDPENARAQQKLVGTVQIAPPFDERGRVWPRPLDRITVSLKTEATRGEINELKRQAVERLPLMDRIWFLRNVAAAADSLRRLSLLLPEMKSLPESCRGLDLTAYFDRVDREWMRLLDADDENDAPGDEKETALRRKAGKIPLFPGAQLLWAYRDARLPVPAQTRRQVLKEPVSALWKGKRPLTTEELTVRVEAVENEKKKAKKNA